MRIGFIGLGNAGGKLAGSLLRNDYDLTVRDLHPEVAQPSSPQQTTKRFYEDGNPSGAEAGSGEAGSPAANERDANNKAAEEKPCTKGESCLNPNSKSAMGDKEAQNLKDSGKL